MEETKEYCEKLIREASEELTNNKNYTRSLELFTEVQVISEKNKWDKELFLAQTGIGIIYSEVLNYGDALEYFLEAYKISLKSLDVHGEMTSLINIAIIYWKEGNHDRAVEYMKKVYDDTEVLKDTLLMGISAINLSIFYNKMGQVELASDYIQISMNLTKDNKQHLLHAQVSQIENLFLRDKNIEAKLLADELMPNIQGIQNKEHRINTYLTLSKIYDREKDRKMAIHYALLSMNENPDIKDKFDIYNQLSNVYFNNQQYDLALNYKDSVLVAKDSLNLVTNSLHLENNRIKFEMENYQRDLAFSKEKLTKERMLFLLIILIAIIVIGLIWMFAVREKQKKVWAEKNEKLITLELEQEKNNKLLLEKQLKENETLALLEYERFQREQKTLKNEIEIKNRELMTKAMYLSGKNELIDKIYDSLRSMSGIDKKNEILKYVKELKDQVKSESEWGSFLLYFEEVNQTFIYSLKEKHPSLTRNDVRFLSYIYIGLNTKEISSLLNITIDSCKKKKMRISQKINLPGGAYSLYDYLLTL